MKKITVILLFLFFAYLETNCQNIYGFVEKYFCSFNISNNTFDTLIEFSGEPGLKGGFRSVIDRYNGRYFFAGSLPGHKGLFHIIDLVDLSIQSDTVYPEHLEYDFIKDRIVYDKNGSFFSLNLSNMVLTNLGIVDIGNSYIWGQMRTYNPQSNQFIYVDYSKGTQGDPYYLVIDADTGQKICETLVEKSNSISYVPDDFITNNLSGDIIANRNGRFGIVNPCLGEISKLSLITDYMGHLDNQMAVYNHLDNTYIIPYYSADPQNRFRIAIVDVYHDKIIKLIDQHWQGKMNLQQIYEQPTAALVYLHDTLFVPKGQHYRWFMNEDFLGETNDNYWIPTKNGNYKAEVDFREYTSTSTEKYIDITSVGNKNNLTDLTIYPNPVTSHLHIESTLNDILNLQIIDLMGKIIYNNSFTNFNSTEREVNVKDFSAGSYLLKVETKKHSYSARFIKI